MHLVSLGDSVIDNKAYVGADEPDVRQQLHSLLGDAHQVTSCAVDGSMTSDIVEQLKHIPADAAHLVISMGENDLIDRVSYVDYAVHSVMESMIILGNLSDQFRKQYYSALQDILNLGLPTIVCTVYSPRLEDLMMQTVSVTALQTFNDCIFQEVTSEGLPLIDLRSVCSEDSDFANPLEASVIGGQKIAESIKFVLDSFDFEVKRTQVYV